MVAMSSLVQANIGVAAVSIAYCFHEAKKLQVFSSLVSPSMMVNQPANLRLAVAAAGGSTLFLGLSLLEQAFFREDSTVRGPIASTLDFLKTLFGQEPRRKGLNVNQWIDGYNHLQRPEDASGRNQNYDKMVDYFYELVTPFYEWGWGSSFHFAYRLKGESFAESMRRHEYYLASWLGLAPGSKVLDLGCGIGGPTRNIGRLTGWNMMGITLNEYQVKRGTELSRQQNLSHAMEFRQADFMKPLDFIPDNSFDGVVSIEATCHSPDRSVVFKEIFRVMKPGAVFANYEWCLTDKYDKNNPEHCYIKKKIEEGNSLPDMLQTKEIDKILMECGFEIVISRDMTQDLNQEHAWYMPLVPSWNPLLQRFQFNWFGKLATCVLLYVFENLRIVPVGTYKVQSMLQVAAVACVEGGRTGTFTPMYIFAARKPRDSSSLRQSRTV